MRKKLQARNSICLQKVETQTKRTGNSPCLFPVTLPMSMPAWVNHSIALSTNLRRNCKQARYLAVCLLGLQATGGKRECGGGNRYLGVFFFPIYSGNRESYLPLRYIHHHTKFLLFFLFFSLSSPSGFFLLSPSTALLLPLYSPLHLSEALLPFATSITSFDRSVVLRLYQERSRTFLPFSDHFDSLITIVRYEFSYNRFPKR